MWYLRISTSVKLFKFLFFYLGQCRQATLANTRITRIFPYVNRVVPAPLTFLAGSLTYLYVQRGASVPAAGGNDLNPGDDEQKTHVVAVTFQQLVNTLRRMNADGRLQGAADQLLLARNFQRLER